MGDMLGYITPVTMHWNSTPQVGKLDFELESWAILSSKKRDGKRQPREFEHLKGMLLGYCWWFTQVPPKHDSALVSSRFPHQFGTSGCIRRCCIPTILQSNRKTQSGHTSMQPTEMQTLAAGWAWMTNIQKLVVQPKPLSNPNTAAAPRFWF